MVHKQLRSNLLRDHVLPLLTVRLHHLEPHLRYRCLRQGVLPIPFCPSPHELSCKLPRAGNPQDLSHAVGNQPRLCTKEQHQLNNGFEEKSRHLRSSPLPAKDIFHPPPQRPRLCNIQDHHQKIVICRQHQSPQVSKGGHHLKGYPISAEQTWGYHTLLLRRQTLLLLLRPFIALCCTMMLPQLPRHQNFAERATWVEEIYLFQYDHGVLDVLVPEVHPHRRPCRRPDATTLNREGYFPCPCWKHHPVCPGIFSPIFSVNLLPPNPLRHAVLGLAVYIQWTPCQVLPEPQEVNPLPLPLPIAPLHPRHHLDVGFVWPYLVRPAWVAYHPTGFLGFCLQPHPVEESR